MANQVRALDRDATKPVMGDQTPRAKAAVDNAEKALSTDSHRYGYMISFAQGLELELSAKQAEIDRLMLEYCPDEMTPEQTAEWAKHQKPVEE